MGGKAIQKDRLQKYYGGELVVALEHLALLRNELGTAVDGVSEDARLGLALVELSDVDAAVHSVRRRRDGTHPETSSLPETNSHPERSAGLDGLNLLLFELRSTFGSRYGGWSPTMGKNRVMEGVQLFPYISGGSDPAVAPRWPAEGHGWTGPATAPAAHAGQGVTVGVLDTQLFAHPDLTGRFIAGPESLIGAAQTPPSWLGHATFVAGLVVKCAPRASLDVRSVLDRDGATASAWDVATRLTQFADAGVDVLNLSFGCFTDDGQPPLLLGRAIDRLATSTVIVAAAGNYGAVAPDRPPLGPKTPIWPAAFDGVIAVGAADGPDRSAAFSPTVPWVDVLAPGVNVVSAYLEGEVASHGPGGDSTEKFDGYAEWSGTSFAAAIVTGAIAAHTRLSRRPASEALGHILRTPEIASRYGMRGFTADS